MAAFHQMPQLAMVVGHVYTLKSKWEIHACFRGLRQSLYLCHFPGEAFIFH